MRTDTHNNPTAFTTDVAHSAGLLIDTEFTVGDEFKVGNVIYKTARLIGNPVELTIRVIDRIGFHTFLGAPRWTYIALPFITWKSLTHDQKRDIIGWMYQHEGGTEMRALFPNYGAK